MGHQELLDRSAELRRFTFAMKAVLRDARDQRLVVDNRPEFVAVEGIADHLDSLAEDLEIFAMEQPTPEEA